MNYHNMNIDLNKWKEFVQEIKDKDSKIQERMKLWYSENPIPRSKIDYFLWNAQRKWELLSLQSKFDYTEPTFENFLTWLANK